MHLYSHLRSASAILQRYDGNVPFAAWLKAHFKLNKKFGSTDRRMIADLCFCFFRLGDAFTSESMEEQLLIGQFLCHEGSPFLYELKREWSDSSSLPVKERLSLLPQRITGSFFPFLDAVSEQINKDAFRLSHLVQPDLFLRIRPGKRELTIKKLQAAKISFSMEGDCLRLPINTKLSDVLLPDEEAVVQDKSSQRVLDALERQIQNDRCQTLSAWDCCAASGGKSILLHDLFSNAQLSVSDVRESILYNLKNRFGRAGIRRYHAFVADVSLPGFYLNKKFDVIICDVPCSGSGTWGRTPERLRFFQKEKIEKYASLQKAIAINAGRCLKDGGMFLYITCSVFKKENEEIVKHITQQTSLRLLAQEYSKGYEDKADTLFTALFSL